MCATISTDAEGLSPMLRECEGICETFSFSLPLVGDMALLLDDRLCERCAGRTPVLPILGILEPVETDAGGPWSADFSLSYFPRWSGSASDQQDV